MSAAPPPVTFVTNHTVARVRLRSRELAAGSDQEVKMAILKAAEDPSSTLSRPSDQWYYWLQIGDETLVAAIGLSDRVGSEDYGVLTILTPEQASASLRGIRLPETPQEALQAHDMVLREVRLTSQRWAAFIPKEDFISCINGKLRFVLPDGSVCQVPIDATVTESERGFEVTWEEIIDV